jgi:putative serine protease PepD
MTDMEHTDQTPAAGAPGESPGERPPLPSWTREPSPTAWTPGTPPPPPVLPKSELWADSAPAADPFGPGTPDSVAAAIGPDGIPRTYGLRQPEPEPAVPERPAFSADASKSEPSPAPDRGSGPRSSGAHTLAAAIAGGLVGALVVGAAMLAIVGGPSGLRATTTGSATLPAATTTVSNLPANPDVGGDQQNRIEAVAAKVTPAIVSVSIQQQGVNPFTGQPISQSGNGSGVIIRSDGYILTNNHVVEGASRITIRFGTQDLVARVIGADSSTDLAVVKVNRTGLPVAQLGNSSALHVGQTVIAIGSPFGLDKTVTLGIISALARSEAAGGRNGVTAYSNLIQTDAAINPGNSGGALVDDSGQVIGINALIQSPSGSVGAAQSAGIGFAIPIDFAKDVADQLIATGTVQHPYLGVATVPLDAALAMQFGVSATSGAIIQLVQPGSPAERAGLKVNDVILKIGDKAISGSEDVFTAVRGHKVGDRISVVIERKGKQLTIDVTLGSDKTATPK